MDDFNISTLHESRNEWSARLISILTPLVIDGYKSILDEAVKLCKENNEMEKYLMTFQNFITRVPKWNPAIIENERKRICEKSGCAYLEDLITCVHIIQLKILTVMRVGQKQKKIDINIPKLDDFIHKVYIHVARKVYKNVYLFELNVPPLQIQKYNRELEVIVQECILNTLRESVPVEAILKAYMDETMEEDVVEEVKEEYIHEPLKNDNDLNQHGVNIESQTQTQLSGGSKLSFNDVDSVKDQFNREEQINAPKDIQRLEELSEIRYNQRKLENDLESDDEDSNNSAFAKLNISDEAANLDALDVHVINEPELETLPDLIIDDIELLE
jgi:GTP:adenosylcobinamide-phosphate guanylyltransferase